MNQRIYSIFLKAVKTKEMIILFIFIILLAIIAILINFIIVKDTILISILSSMIASILILIIYKLLDAKKDSILDVYNKYGLKNIYSKKTDATSDFTDNILKAKNRVWAIGMTNKSFIKQQKENINNILKKKKPIDIKIIYWNDCTVIGGQDNISKSIIDVQLALENQNSLKCTADITEHKTIRDIHTSIKKLQESIDIVNHANIEIGFLSVPSSFSCLVVDDNVYFFPFLSNHESNISPMILCDANKTIGVSIINHFKYIFDQQVYYISKKLNDKTFTHSGREDYEDCINGE
jgi:hypothetical protein